MPDLSTGVVLGPVVRFLAGHPAVAPTVLVLGAVAWLLSGPLSLRLQRGRGLTAMFLVCAAVPFALTLAPSPDPGYPLRWCVTELRPVSDWGRGGQELANIAMLGPFGLLVMVALGRRAAVVALLLGAAFPFVVELLQYAVPAIGRICETTDVALNLVGLMIGVLVGLPARLLVGRRTREPVEA